VETTFEAPPHDPGSTFTVVAMLVCAAILLLMLAA